MLGMLRLWRVFRGPDERRRRRAVPEGERQGCIAGEFGTRQACRTGGICDEFDCAEGVAFLSAFAVIGNEAIAFKTNFGRQALLSRGSAMDARPLTAGEKRLVQSIFGHGSDYARATIHAHNYWWPFPNDRAMAPDGNIYFAKGEYHDDFSLATVPLDHRATFVHEAAHLYQYWVLR
jgi:hypothetical protein